MTASEIELQLAAGTADALLVEVLSIALRATALVMGAGVFSFFALRSSAAVRHLIWAMSLAGIVALPLLTVALPQVGVPLPPGLAALSRIAPSIALRIGGSAPSRSSEPSKSLEGLVPGPPVHASGGSGTGGVEGSVWTPARARSALVPLLILCVWSCGGLLVLALGGTERWRLRAIRRRAHPVGGRALSMLARLAADCGVRDPVRALTGPATQVPATWGIFRPILLLPDGYERWPHSRLTSVLRHELAHIRRRDYLSQFCAQLACAIYWFHPLVWLAARRLRIESEHACDDVVVESGMRPADYAHELVELAAVYARRGLARGDVPAVIGRTLLGRRVIALLDPNRARRPPRRGMTLLAGLAATLLVAVTASGSFVPMAADEPAPAAAVKTPRVDQAAARFAESEGFRLLSQVAGSPARPRSESGGVSVAPGNSGVPQHDPKAFPGFPRLLPPDSMHFEWGDLAGVTGPPAGPMGYDFDGERDLFGQFVRDAIHPAVMADGRLDQRSTANLAQRVASRLWSNLAITVWFPEGAGGGPIIGVTGNSRLDVNPTSRGPLRIDLRALDGPFNQVIPRLVLRELPSARLDLSPAERSALYEQLSSAGDDLRAAWMNHLLKARQP